MKLLQVIAHAADGNTVYKFGKKAVSYDWDKAALLADSMSQVFYNSQSFWLGSIEVYFDLNGKRFCAGRSSQTGTVMNYLAGEDDGQAVFYARDYDAMIKYLNDFVNGDFLERVRRWFITNKDFSRFCSDRSSERFALAANAAKEAAAGFDIARQEELRAIVAVPVLKEDCDRADERVRAVDARSKSVEEEITALSAEREELEKWRVLALEKEDYERRISEFAPEAAEADALEERLTKWDQAEKLARLIAERDAYNKQVVSGDNERKNAIIVLTSLERAKKYVEEKQAYDEYAQQAGELEKEIKAAEDEMKAADEKVKKLSAEKDAKRAEFERACQESDKAENEQKKAEEKVAAELVSSKKRIAELNDVISSDKKKIEENKKKLPQAEDDYKKADKLISDIKAVGFTQKQYDDAVKAEENRKAEHIRLVKEITEDNERRTREAEEENRRNVQMREDAQRELAEIATTLNSLEKRDAYLTVEKDEAEFAVDKKNAYRVDQKYYGMGYTRAELDQYKKGCVSRIEQINSELTANANLREDLTKRQKELFSIASKDIVPVEVKLRELPVFEEKEVLSRKGFNENQNVYANALENGNGEACYKEADDIASKAKENLDTLKQEADKLNKEMNDAEKEQKKLSDGMKKANEDLEKQKKEAAKKVINDKRFVYEGERQLEDAGLEKRKAELKIDELKRKADGVERRPEPQELNGVDKDYADHPDSIESLIIINQASIADNEKKQADAQKKVEQIDGEIKDKLNQYGMKETEVEGYRMTNEEGEELHNKLDSLRARQSALESEKSRYEGIPDGITQSLEQNEGKISAAHAELENLRNERIAAENDCVKIAAEFTAFVAVSEEYNKLAKASDGIEDRKFASSKEAQEYLDAFMKDADALMKKFTDGKKGIVITENVDVTDGSEVISWEKADASTKLLAYISCLVSTPDGNANKEKFVVVDGNIDIDREFIEEAVNKGNVTLKNSTQFVPVEEKPAKTKKKTTKKAEQPADENAQEAVNAEGQPTGGAETEEKPKKKKTTKTAKKAEQSELNDTAAEKNEEKQDDDEIDAAIVAAATVVKKARKTKAKKEDVKTEEDSSDVNELPAEEKLVEVAEQPVEEKVVDTPEAEPVVEEQPVETTEAPAEESVNSVEETENPAVVAEPEQTEETTEVVEEQPVEETAEGDVSTSEETTEQLVEGAVDATEAEEVTEEPIEETVLLAEEGETVTEAETVEEKIEPVEETVVEEMVTEVNSEDMPAEESVEAETSVGESIVEGTAEEQNSEEPVIEEQPLEATEAPVDESVNPVEETENPAVVTDSEQTEETSEVVEEQPVEDTAEEAAPVEEVAEENSVEEAVSEENAENLSEENAEEVAEFEKKE